MKKFKKFSEYDEDLYEDRSDRRRHLKEKRMQSALRSKNIDQLIDMDDEYY